MKNIFLYGLLAMVSMVISYFIFGFHYETNDDLIYVFLMQGMLTPEPVVNFYDAHIFISNIYAFLYQKFPNIAWYAWIHYGMFWVASTLSFLLIDAILKKHLSLWGRIFFGLLFFMGGILPSLVWFNYTRTVLLLSFSSLIAYLWVTDKNEKPSSFTTFILLILFVWTLLTRFMAVYLSLGLLIPFYFLWHLNKENSLNFSNIKRAVFPLMPIALILLFFMIGEHFLMSEEEQGYHAKSSAVHLSKGLTTIPPNSTPRDSIIRWSLYNFMWGDPQIMTAENLTKLTSNDYLSEPVFSQNNFKKTRWLLKDKLLMSKLLVGLNIWIFLCLLWDVLRYKQYKRRLLFFVLLHLIFWVMLVGISMQLKMNNRVFQPMLMGLTLTSFCFLYQVNRPKDTFYEVAVWGLLLLLPFLHQDIQKLKEPLKDTAISQEKQLQAFEEINQTEGKTYIFTPAVFTFFADLDPLKTIRFNPQNCYIFTFGWMTLFPSYPQQLEAVGNTRVFEEFIKNTQGNPNILWLSDDYANTMLYHYLRLVYGLELNFRTFKGSTTLENLWQKKYYWLEVKR